MFFPFLLSSFFMLRGTRNILCSFHFFCLLSSVFCLLSFFLTICFFFHMLDRISTKLGHKYLWVTGYKSYASIWPQRSRRGHEVKFKIFTKKDSTPLRSKLLLWNLGAWRLSTFSTKVMGWQKYVGSYGVTGVKIRGQIFKFVRFQRLRCQIVRLDP